MKHYFWYFLSKPFLRVKIYRNVKDYSKLKYFYWKRQSKYFLWKYRNEYGNVIFAFPVFSFEQNYRNYFLSVEEENWSSCCITPRFFIIYKLETNDVLSIGWVLWHIYSSNIYFVIKFLSSSLIITRMRYSMVTITEERQSLFRAQYFEKKYIVSDILR